MARFQSSTFGKISGKHGTAVAAIRKDGTCILKVYRAASNPNTIGQKNQRGKFGFVMKELNCMRSLFTQNFGGQYGINKVVATVMKTAVFGEFPDFELDYSKLMISEGNLFGTAQVDAIMKANNLEIYWNTDLISDASPTDMMHLILLNPISKQIIEKHDCAIRTDGNIVIELPAIWSGYEILAWIYFSTSNNNKYSNSQYIGKFSI